MPTLMLPDVLLRITGLPERSVSSEGETVKELLTSACQKFPELSAHLFYESGAFKDHFILSISGELGHMESPLQAEQEVELLLASSGGLDEERALTREEVQRYARHLTLPNVGRKGQLKIKHSRVLIIGTGGLGSPVAMYLAAAGVGTIGLIDHDIVEESNLQRQIAHGTSTIGMPKVESAKRRLLDLNPHININAYHEALNKDNAEAIIGAHDLVVDGTDNFSTRYLVNDVCVQLSKPLVYGAISQFDGQVSVFNHKASPCYRCLFPHTPPAELAPNCVGGGVIGVLPGVVGLLQATEAIKLMIGIGEPLAGRLLRFDALSMRFNELKFKRRDDCAGCGSKKGTSLDEETSAVCSTMPLHERIPDEWRITPQQLQQRLAAENSDVRLLDVRDEGELEICQLPQSLHIPLASLHRQLSDLNPTQEIVVICRSGVRADRATQLLRGAGFDQAVTLAGGILGWAKDVDSSMPSY